MSWYYLPEDTETQDVARETQKQGDGWRHCTVHSRIDCHHGVCGNQVIAPVPRTTGHGRDIACLVHRAGEVNIHTSTFLSRHGSSGVIVIIVVVLFVVVAIIPRVIVFVIIIIRVKMIMMMKAVTMIMVLVSVSANLATATTIRV